jgi:hypothetical protein
MEDVASSHAFVGDETVSNKATGKEKMPLGNVLICTLTLTVTRINVAGLLSQKTMT